MLGAGGPSPPTSAGRDRVPVPGSLLRRPLGHHPDLRARARRRARHRDRGRAPAHLASRATSLAGRRLRRVLPQHAARRAALLPLPRIAPRRPALFERHVRKHLPRGRPARREHRDRAREEHFAGVDDRGHRAALRGRDRRVAHVPGGGVVRDGDAPLPPPHDPARPCRELPRAAPGGGAMRPDTWGMFVDPAILRFFGQGLLETLSIAAASTLVSFPAGLLFALGRLSRRAWIRWPSIAYIEAIRALPVLLLIVYFGIKGSTLFRPLFGPDFDLPRFWAGVLGLSLYTSAVLAEIIRAGIVSLPRGQAEAARALGLSYAQSLRHVILPQALRLMVPAMMGQLTTGIKDTSLVGTIGVFELLRQGRTIYTQFFNPIEVLLFVSLVYFVVCFALSQGSRRLEVGRVPRIAQVKVQELQLRDQAA